MVIAFIYAIRFNNHDYVSSQWKSQALASDAIPSYTGARMSFTDRVDAYRIRLKHSRNENIYNLLPVTMRQIKNAAEKRASILPQFVSDIFPLDTPEIS